MNPATFLLDTTTTTTTNNNNPQRIRKGIGTVGNQRKNQDHSDYRSVKIGRNSLKSPGVQGDLLSLGLN